MILVRIDGNTVMVHLMFRFNMHFHIIFACECLFTHWTLIDLWTMYGRMMPTITYCFTTYFTRVQWRHIIDFIKYFTIINWRRWWYNSWWCSRCCCWWIVWIRFDDGWIVVVVMVDVSCWLYQRLLFRPISWNRYIRHPSQHHLPYK